MKCYKAKLKIFVAGQLKQSLTNFLKCHFKIYSCNFSYINLIIANYTWRNVAKNMTKTRNQKKLKYLIAIKPKSETRIK